MNDDAVSPNAQRGAILFEQGRYPEAETFFRQALAQDPNDADVLAKLAVCEVNLSRAADAHATVLRAIALEPEVAPLHALKALIEVQLNKPREALKSAAQALELDPESDDAFTAQAAAYVRQQEWAKAETSARAALELNPDNASAANQLAHALRLQNRLHESSDQIAYMLARDPEDADTHAVAGWTALQKNQRVEAEGHFVEALRLDPGNEGAREGLKEAFRARSPIYRIYLNYCFFMQRFTAGKQWLIIIGLLVIVRVAQAVLGPYATIVIGAYLLFVLWVHVARPVGNLQLALDRTARHALDRSETIEAWVTGGGVMLGFLMFLGGMIFGWPVPRIVGATLVGAAFPFAYTFTNSSAGKWLFAAFGALVIAAGLANIFEYFAGDADLRWVSVLTGFAMLGVIATTWLANVSALRSRG